MSKKKQLIIELIMSLVALILLVVAYTRLGEMVVSHTRYCSEPVYTSFWDRYAGELLLMVYIMILALSFFVISRIIYIKRMKQK